MLEIIFEDDHDATAFYISFSIRTIGTTSLSVKAYGKSGLKSEAGFLYSAFYGADSGQIF